MQAFRQVILLILLLSCSLVQPALAKVQPQQYGLAPITAQQEKQMLAASMDSLLRTHRTLANTRIVSGIQREKEFKDKTPDFYLLLTLCMFLGIIRVIDPKYFGQLWKSFRNPAGSSRHVKDQLENASFSAVLANLFFAMTAGAYIYYLIKLFIPQRTGDIPPSLLIVMLIAGMMVIYLVKYAVMRFSGWAFKVEGITQHYVFNVFLINKLIGILLLPFTILLAFAEPALSGPAVILSLILVGLLLINRYTRSWQVFGSFFQYSRFHFFMYLCASELLPLAVLTKLLVRGLVN
ncbi:DUF4271 domain-containing protein [Polluticoccus soli]|uniref:DUF4271 domain-containing protein n=1 Tax=Polluticoccus soli TaxID=3034150 RepID=UPI0023E1B9AE|nr:DUF4271 domain-containing protein [Flavipsychrobacter sp. JY13-12]